MWQKIYAWAKKIHNWIMWAVIVLGTVMMASGYLMNRQLAGESLPEKVDMIFVRQNHVVVSMWFLWALLAQIITGLAMWTAPKMIARQRKVTHPES